MCSCFYCKDGDSHRSPFLHDSFFDLLTHLSSQILKGNFFFKLKTFKQIFNNGPHEVIGDSLQCDIIKQGCQSVHQISPMMNMSQPRHLQGCLRGWYLCFSQPFSVNRKMKFVTTCLSGTKWNNVCVTSQCPR